MTATFRCKYCGELYASSERKDETNKTMFMCGTIVKGDLGNKNKPKSWTQTRHCEGKVKYQKYLRSENDNDANVVIQKMNNIAWFCFGFFMGVAVASVVAKEFFLCQ